MAQASCPSASIEAAPTATAATPSCCRLCSRCGSVSSSRRSWGSVKRASSPPCTLSKAGKRARIRQDHVTRRSNPPAPATSCASREASSVRILRTEADDIGGCELLILHAYRANKVLVSNRKARRLSPRCRGGNGASRFLLCLAFLFRLLFLDAMLPPGDFLRLVHMFPPLKISWMCVQ